MATMIYIGQHTCSICQFTGMSRWVVDGYDEEGGILWLCADCRHAREQARARESRLMPPFHSKDPAKTAPLKLPKGE